MDCDVPFTIAENASKIFGCVAMQRLIRIITLMRYYPIWIKWLGADLCVNASESL